MLTPSSGSRRAQRMVVAAVALTLVAAACSGSSKPATAPVTTTTLVPMAPCHRPAAAPVTSVPVSGVASDSILTSFDGTQIRVHWFPVAGPPKAGAPTILMGPGWGSGGDTNTTTSGSQGVVTIKDLRDAGYNVLTWDPRGFGQSTGTIEIDSAAAEGRDVGRIIDWLAAQPGVQLDAPGDPRLGMVGESYGGGIQLTTASIDCRVDAIVPSWAWNSLATSLDKANTVKTGWSTLLYAAANGHKLDPHIVHANQTGTATGFLDAADSAYFIQRGPGDAVNQIRIPTLFVQGTVDTLFTLDEAVTNYTILRRHHVPTSMIWFCGGHGVCLTNPGDRALVEQKTLLWLARYVKRDARVNTGPGFVFVDQNGTSYSGDHYPLRVGAAITSSGFGNLKLSRVSTSGPAHPPANNPDLLANFVGPITPARGANALNVAVPLSRSALIVGAPQLRLIYTGRATPGTRPTRVFAQLLDARTGIVLGNQITPIAITLDGRQHTTTVPLEMVAYTASPTTKLVLQIVATTVAYSQPRLGGRITIETLLALPTVSGAKIVK